MDAITLKNVTKHYKNFTLDNVSFSVPNGVIMGFIGENGAGKSTTINLIMDLIRRDSGEITVLGRDNLTELNEVKEYIGVVLDECCFPEGLTGVAADQVLKRIYETWDSQKFRSYLDRFSILPTKSIKDYSRGMKMKLSMAVALSHDSHLLILDEATSGLDPIVRDELLDILNEFTIDEGRSILLSSHILSDLEKICDYITFIHNGRIIFTDEKDKLLESYAIVKCSEAELKALDKSAVVGVRKNAFGVEALVKRGARLNLHTERATIEDIMVYYVKGRV